jgi:hypothetical protein
MWTYSSAHCTPAPPVLRYPSVDSAKHAIALMQDAASLASAGRDGVGAPIRLRWAVDDDA